jgi:hypothetical protein
MKGLAYGENFSIENEDLGRIGEDMDFKNSASF